MKPLVTRVKPALKILCLFDYGPATNTGFSTVSKNIIPFIKKAIRSTFGETRKLKLDIVAINHFGDMYTEDADTTVVSAIKSMPIGKSPELRDDFGRYGFLNILANSNQDMPGDNTPPCEWGYDGLFIIQDPAIMNSLVPDLDVIKRRFKQENKKQFKSIVYFPIDHDITSDAMINRMDFFDEIVTYNEFSRDQVLKLRPKWRGKLRAIPHGIDLDNFYPLTAEENEDFRKTYFGENADKFIVLNLNRNQPRKDIPCTIFGFEHYHQSHPDSLLYLHMNPKDPLGWDLRGLLSQTSLVEGRDFMFPPKEVENHGATVEALNRIYNACDVYLTTTLGEGWGLGVTEAMACGTPVICPLHTSLIEITDHGRRATVLENLYPIAQVSDNTKREQCDYIEVSEKLHEVRIDLISGEDGEVFRKKQEALKYIETLSWESIGYRWADLMLKTY